MYIPRHAAIVARWKEDRMASGNRVPAAVVRRHVAAQDALGETAKAGDLEAFEAAEAEASAAARTYRKELQTRGFSTPYGLG